MMTGHLAVRSRWAVVGRVTLGSVHRAVNLVESLDDSIPVLPHGR